MMKERYSNSRVRREKEEAQSEIIGLVTIFGIVFISISIILLAGLPIVENATENTQIERFQTEFALLDQQIRESVYGPGQSSASLNPAGGSISVDDGSNSMAVRITYRPETGPADSTDEIRLGGIEYDSEGSRGVAYEGGGVWAKYRGDALSLRKPPDMTHSGTSLEMNMMNFTSNKTAGGTADQSFYFTSEGAHRSSELRGITNRSLDPGELELSVRSQYAEAWAAYFNRTMASSTVEVERDGSPDERGYANVTFETGPPLYSVENSLNHTSSNDANIGNQVNLTDSRAGDAVLGSYTNSDLPPDGVDNLPNVAGICFRTFEGEDLGSVSSPVTSGTYETDTSNEISGETFVADGGDIEVYSDTSNLNFNSGDTTTFDTSGGTVEIHVDGQLTLNGDIEINGTNSVYFYVRDTVHVQGNSNVNIEDGRTERLQILGTERAEIRGAADYNGTVYAQNTIEMQNNVEMTGAAVSAGTSDRVEVNNADYTHDTSLRGEAPDCADQPLRNFNAVERRVGVR
jgi:hypothetical protein